MKILSARIVVLEDDFRNEQRLNIQLDYLRQILLLNLVKEIEEERTYRIRIKHISEYDIRELEGLFEITQELEYE